MNVDTLQKVTRWLAAFSVLLSVVAAVANACDGSMSAAMGYASAAMYAICWRIELGTRRPEDDDAH